MGIKKGLTFMVRPFSQGNIFNSKNLYNMFINSVMPASCCFLYVKDTNLKANHNKESDATLNPELFPICQRY